MAIIFPRCKDEMLGAYISTEGYVLPCCWLGCEPYLTKFKIFLNSDFELLNISLNSLDHILNSSAYKKVEESWRTDKPFSGCMQFCSSPSQVDSKKMQGMDIVEIIDLKKLVK